jgi:ornithine cyclodeaminase/alanine dehydrogenase-like protein (mu-crystallin family)
MTLFINEKHIAAMINDGTLTMSDFVDAMEAAYRDQGEGNFEILPRQNFEVPREGTRNGSLKIGAACLRGVGVMGASLYSGGYGGMNLWVTLYDTANGKVRAILHGHIIGQMKTGATAGMAARWLARDDARTVGILGSGDQARTQLLGLAAVRGIERVKVHSPTRANLEAYVAWARETLPDIDTTAMDGPEETVRESDIVVTITNTREPILEADWIAPGTHCAIVGAHYPDRREIDAKTLKLGRVIVDDIDQAFNEKGEILIPLAAGEITRDIVKGAIGEVIAGHIPGRTAADEITLFLSGGTGIEYMGASAMIHARAAAAGIGQELDYDENR